MAPDKLAEYMDLMKYSIGTEIEGKITVDGYTNSLEVAEKYFDRLIKKYNVRDVEDHIILFIYDTENAKRIKEYDNTTDIC